MPASVPPEPRSAARFGPRPSTACVSRWLTRPDFLPAGELLLKRVAIESEIS
jgi:hypothetical protein